MESAMGVAKRKQPRKPYTWRSAAGSRLGLNATQRRTRSARTTVAGPPYSMPAWWWRQLGRAKEAGCGSGMGRAGALGPQWNDARLAKNRAAAAAAWQRTQLEDAGGEQRLHAPQRGADGACGAGAARRECSSASASYAQRTLAPSWRRVAPRRTQEGHVALQLLLVPARAHTQGNRGAPPASDQVAQAAAHARFSQRAPPGAPQRLQVRRVGGV